MALSQDATSSGNDYNTDTLTIAHTCGGSANKLTVRVAWRDQAGSSPTVSSITYNGTNLTQSSAVASQNWATDNYDCAEIWYLDNPDTGSSYNVVITLSETADSGTISGVVTSYNGAASGETGASGTGTGNSANPSVTFTTNESGAEIIAIANSYATSASGSPGTGTTEDYDYGDGGGTNWGGYETASGGSDTIDCTITTSQNWGMAALEIRPGVVSGDPEGHLIGGKLVGGGILMRGRLV